MGRASFRGTVSHAVRFCSQMVTVRLLGQCNDRGSNPGRDMHGNGIPNGTGNPMGMGIKHRIWNGRE